MSNDFESAFGPGEVVVVNSNPTSVVEEKIKMAVKNVARLSDEALAKKLRDHGVEVPETSDRAYLIAQLKEHKLWDYSGNIVNSKFKSKYAKNGGNCGDLVSKAFGTMEDNPESDARLRAIAEANGLNYNKWSHCNFGQRKMNLGNVLRGMIRRGESAIIETTEWINGELVMSDGELVVGIEEALKEA